MADTVPVPKAKIQRVKEALNLVRSNGQAVAAVEAALSAAKMAAKALRDEGGPFRLEAAKNVDQYADRVRPFAKQLTGQANARVSEATWTKAREQIFALYMLLFTTEADYPAGADFGDSFFEAVSTAVAELPATVGKAVKVVSKAATEVVKETAKVGGSVVWGFVQGAWPLLLVGGLVLAGYLVVKGKLIKAVIP